MENISYLDNAATTPVCREALDELLRASKEIFGNPSSLHSAGFAAERLIEDARRKIAAVLGGSPDELIFTPGGSFGDNLAILGAARKNSRKGRHIITTQIEHDAVLNSVAALEAEGFEVTRIAPKQDGRVCTEDVLNAVRPDTVLVSVMLVNNELGTVQPVSEIARGLKRLRSNALLHTDAVQAFCKVNFSVKTLGADMVTVSAHKVHGPKGIGALWVRKGVRLSPITFGGGQEKGLCPGTESAPAISAFAAAVGARDRAHRAEELKEKALALLADVPGLQIISRGETGVCMVSLPGFRSETLLHRLSAEGIFVSSGSACGKGKPSHVLTAMGLPREIIDGAIRISFSKYNTEEDAVRLNSALIRAVSELAHV
ncbi:MAG: cysteine desulfurase [Clostridia bacterium]|nr:cysteine desulfurase [Clostridia bacterium]